MTRITQHLWFERGMEEAVTFYTSLIPGSALHWVSSLPADSPSGPAGSVRLAGFTPGHPNYQAIEAGPLDPFNHSFSIMVECDEQAEIDFLWEELGKHGSYEQCGWLRDRWGLSWQITPRRLGELMMDADPARVKRGAEAMMQMVKFDNAALAAAADAG